MREMKDFDDAKERLIQEFLPTKGFTISGTKHWIWIRESDKILEVIDTSKMICYSYHSNHPTGPMKETSKVIQELKVLLDPDQSTLDIPIDITEEERKDLPSYDEMYSPVNTCPACGTSGGPEVTGKLTSCPNEECRVQIYKNINPDNLPDIDCLICKRKNCPHRNTQFMPNCTFLDEDGRSNDDYQEDESTKNSSESLAVMKDITCSYCGEKLGDGDIYDSMRKHIESCPSEIAKRYRESKDKEGSFSIGCEFDES